MRNLFAVVCPHSPTISEKNTILNRYRRHTIVRKWRPSLSKDKIWDVCYLPLHQNEIILLPKKDKWLLKEKLDHFLESEHNRVPLFSKHVPSFFAQDYAAARETITSTLYFSLIQKITLKAAARYHFDLKVAEFAVLLEDESAFYIIEELLSQVRYLTLIGPEPLCTTISKVVFEEYGTVLSYAAPNNIKNRFDIVVAIGAPAANRIVSKLCICNTANEITQHQNVILPENIIIRSPEPLLYLEQILSRKMTLNDCAALLYDSTYTFDDWKRQFIDTGFRFEFTYSSI